MSTTNEPLFDTNYRCCQKVGLVITNKNKIRSLMKEPNTLSFCRKVDNLSFKKAIYYLGTGTYSNQIYGELPSTIMVHLFAQMMKYLHDNGFKVLTMNQLGYDTTTNVFYFKNVPSPTSIPTTTADAIAIANATTLGKHSSS